MVAKYTSKNQIVSISFSFFQVFFFSTYNVASCREFWFQRSIVLLTCESHEISIFETILATIFTNGFRYDYEVIFQNGSVFVTPKETNN